MRKRTPNQAPQRAHTDLSSFHPTSHPKFSNKFVCVAPPSFECITTCSQLPKFAAYGGRSPTPIPFSAPRVTPNSYYLVSAFVSAGETSTIAKMTIMACAAITIPKEISHRSTRIRPNHAFQPPHTFNTSIIFHQSPALGPRGASIYSKTSFFLRGPHSEPLPLCWPRPSCSRLAPPWAHKHPNRRKGIAPEGLNP